MLWFSGAVAQDAASTRQHLNDVRGAIERDQSKKAELEQRAADEATELAHLRSESAAVAAKAQAHEAALSALEADLRSLTADYDAKTAALGARKGQLGATLAALQRMALRPTAALLVSPGDPNDVIRSGLLLRTAVPQIERLTAALRDQLGQIAALRRDMAAKRAELAQTGTELERERAELRNLAAAKARAHQQTEQDRRATQQRIAKLVEQAKSLEDLLDRLNRSAAAMPRDKPRLNAPPAGPRGKLAATPHLPPITQAKGRLTPPARGVIVKAFGVPNDTGGHTRGLTWHTRAGATVVAPWEGRVVFAGDFRNFGRILIIDHGQGYHSLIAGLERLDAQMNQWVLAGEPVGVAGSADAENSLNMGGRAGERQGADTSQPTGGATLYVELRHDGQPINPLPWIAVSTDRKRG